MAKVYVFADESGNFDFSRGASASAYYIFTTLTLEACDVGNALMHLRRELAFNGDGLITEFHASEDAQSIRDAVFSCMSSHAFRIDCTILEKAKAHPNIRVTDVRFYEWATFLHFKHVLPRVTKPNDDVLVVSASIGSKKEKSKFHKAVSSVVDGTTGARFTARTASWSASSDPCLQVVDYCSWAIQRKWERQDSRSYDLIKSKIRTEFCPFDFGNKTFY